MYRSFKFSFLLAGIAVSAFAAAPNFRVPPLNSPATAEFHAGKFVWTDLFTADVSTSTKFYTGLFGWEWKTLGTGPAAYRVAYLKGKPVAGAVQRPTVEGETARARWIGYVSTGDIAGVAEKVKSLGGRILLASRVIPDRGEMAVLADPEGALFGLVSSSSGDPADVPAEIGGWAWVQLFAADEVKAADFYKSVFGYEVQLNPRTNLERNAYFLSGGVARAAIARMPVDPGRPKPTWLEFVRVANVADTAAQANKLGGSVLIEPRSDLGDADVAVIADPTGAALGLVALRNSTPAAK